MTFLEVGTENARIPMGIVKIPDKANPSCEKGGKMLTL